MNHLMADSAFDKLRKLGFEWDGKEWNIVVNDSNNSYVWDVPGHCDRVLWRGSYHHLNNTTDYLTSRAERLEEALATMYEYFKPNAWGSDANRREALEMAEAVLGITD